MKFPILLIALCLSSPGLHGQSYFNNLPLSDGLNNQSRLYNVLVDSNLIFAIGDMMDVTIDSLQPTIRPWLAVFNSEGELIFKKVLYHEEIVGEMFIRGIQLLKIDNNRLLINMYIFNNDVGENLLMEIDRWSGEVLKYKIFTNPFDSTSNMVPFILDYLTSKKSFILASFIRLNTHPHMYIMSLDSNYNIINEFLIKDNGRDNYPFYIEQETDTTFVLVGESWKRNNIGVIEVKPYLTRVNYNGSILQFSLGPTINNYSFSFSPLTSFNVLKDDAGNWIFSAHLLVPKGICATCFYALPYTISYSPDMKEMNWATGYAEDINDKFQEHSTYASELDTTSGSILISVVKANQEFRDAFIVKLRLNGDSVWTRHYLPLSFEPENAGWVFLRDIKVTVTGSYVAVGFASALDEGLWRSWIIHIDSFGCFIPGCQNVVGTNESPSPQERIFTVYPNPAHSFIGLLSHGEVDAEVMVSLFDLQGKLVKSLKFNPRFGIQYLLDISQMPAGIYVLGISSKGQLIQTEKITKY